MECKGVRKSLYQLADGELGKTQAESVRAHLGVCHSCAEEWKVVQAFQRLIKIPSESFQPSPGFEARFWNKVAERSAVPAGVFGRFSRLLGKLDSLIPRPSMPQMAMVVLTAFLIGSAGGVVSARTSAGSLETFYGFKGLPASSMAANYLKILEGEKRS